VRRFVVLLPWLVAGCPSGGAKPAAAPATVATRDDEIGLARLVTELTDDILASYDRDEPPDLDTGMIDSRVGTARIGAGPDDVYIAGDLARAPSRWPLAVGRMTSTEVRSKRLAIQIAADQSAAWMADELSWRIEACGRTAVIPLRITALYAHDGDRWVPVFEHLSFGTPPALETAATKPIKSEVISGDLETQLKGVVERGLLGVPHDPLVVAQDPAAMALGPDAGDEWHGAQVLAASILPGKLEDRRIGTVGRSPRDPLVAYWVGTYTADLPARGERAAGKVGMRVTLVFEKRPFAQGAGKAPDAQACAKDARSRARDVECRWILVQSHLSQPITDDELAQRVFGSALIAAAPLQLDCSDRVPRAPAVAPRPGSRPPAVRTP